MPSAAASASASWVVPGADVRFGLKLSGAPTHPECGYFVHLPDGGALPGPVPAPQAVVPKTGEKLETRVLWHNKTGGLWLVFAAPGKGVKRVDLYVSGATRAPFWSEATSKLRPSAILCVAPGKANLVESRKLARLGMVGPATHARNKAGIKRAPLSIGGDDTGRPKPASFYLLAYLNVTDPGKTWVSPFVIAGECEVRIDGKKLKPKKRIEKWGGTGEYFDLDAGLHRLEVYQTAPGTGPYSTHPRKGGLMYLTWRRPHAATDELGGVRSQKVPMSGTSRMETRVLRDKEIARSGRCVIEAVSGRAGRPVACARIVPAQTFWLDGEGPLIVYELRAVTAGQPAGAEYAWEFSGGARMAGASAKWLFPGFRENQVALVAKAGGAESRSVRRFFGFSTRRTSLGNAADREAFREAMATMLASSPADPDPVAKWPRVYWNNLIRTAEPGAGYELLKNLFTVRPQVAAARLSPGQLAMLQGLFLDIQERRDPKQAVKCIDVFRAATGDEKRRSELMIRKAEDLMFYLDDLAAAERGLETLAKGDGELAEWARIRLGDIAFLAGDLNKATSCYAEVQGRARLRRNRLDGLVAEQLVKDPPTEKQGASDRRGGTPRPLKSASAPRRGGNPRPLKSASAPRRGGNPRPLKSAVSGNPRPVKPAAPGTGSSAAPAPDVLPENAANWKFGALRDVSNSENVAKLIDSGFLLEAGEALRKWEREYPLSKISGDLLLVEAKYRMKLGDWKRARVMLDAYCRQIDASSFLPEAVRMLIECARQMKSPPAEIRETVEKVAKRLEYHPVKTELDAFLSSTKGKSK